MVSDQIVIEQFGCVLDYATTFSLGEFAKSYFTSLNVTKQDHSLIDSPS